MLEVHREYQNHVVKGAMTRKVFARLFIEGHRHSVEETIEAKNRYGKVLATVEILLSERADLISRYLTLPSLSDADITQIEHLIYTEGKVSDATEVKEKEQEKEEPKNKVGKETSLRCIIRSEDMALLADCANQAELFKNKVTPSDIRDLMNGKQTMPLVADNLMGIAYFFDKLSCMKLICRRWQSVLELNGSILLQGESKPQTHTNYSSALSRGKASGNFRHKEDIDAWLEHIAAKYTAK